jgi:CheY-like chemotaxis protein
MGDLLKSILLVEDNPNDRELILIALEKMRLANQVTIAHDGAAALDYMFRRGVYQDRAQGNPALILLDLKLPKVDGLEVLKQIKADPTMQHVPIVMLTSSREDKDLVRSYTLGVNAYVVKPVGFTQFVEAIGELAVFWAVLNEPPPGSLRYRP